jgi:hypothetical protein
MVVRPLASAPPSRRFVPRRGEVLLLSASASVSAIAFASCAPVSSLPAPAPSGADHSTTIAIPASTEATAAPSPTAPTRPSADAALAPSALPLDTSTTFSVAVRSDDLSLAVAGLRDETALHGAALVLRVDGDTLRQDPLDLRGIDPLFARAAAAITNLAGPSFRKAFVEITPGARRYGDTQVYRPLPGGGFQPTRYAHKGASGFGFRVGTGGSIWGVSISDPAGERFLTHLAGPNVWPKPPSEAEIGPESFPRTAIAPNGATFTVGRVAERDVVVVQPSAEVSGRAHPLPPIPEIIKAVGFTFLAYDARRAFLFGFTSASAKDKPGESYAVVWENEAFVAESAPPRQRFSSFCVRPDGERWGIVVDPAEETSGAPGRPTHQRLVRRTTSTDPASAWQEVPLPPSLRPANVICDDPRAVWLAAVDESDTKLGSVLLRSAPVKNPVTVMLEDSPLDGNLRGDIEPSFLSVSSYPAQPATTACPADALWAVLARAGGRVEELDPETKRDPLALAAFTKLHAERGEKVRAAMKTATLPDGAKLQTFGAWSLRWIGTRVPSWEEGRKLVDATKVRLPDERPKLLCARPEKIRPYP